MTERLRVVSLFGTRPEAIKMAPVVGALQAADWAESIVVVTGQHREMLDQVLQVFGLRPDEDLDLMRHGQSLTDLAGNALVRVGEVLRKCRPGLLLVQGDTTSAFVGGLAAFYERIPVGHVEAGLRSFDRYNPFPEEINRRLLSVVAEFHFAPTQRARQNLLAEGIDDARIAVTGNTVVDALLSVSRSRHVADLPAPTGVVPGSRMILVTLHRRESWGAPIEAVCRGLGAALDRFPDVCVLFPMHRNPIVRQAVGDALGRHPRAFLTEPLDYFGFVKAMLCCHLVVTDSGGVQEEAPSLGKPSLVVRETTERPEAIEAGTARLIGTSESGVLDAISELLNDPACYDQMSQAANPFGDGTAAARIAAIIKSWADSAVDSR